MTSPVRNVDSSKPLFQLGKGSGSGSGSQHGPSPSKRPRFQDEQRISQSTKNPLMNKESGNIFYKTRLCRKNMQGNCPKGEKCTFAHGLEELHDPPPNWEELVHVKRKRASDNHPRTPSIKASGPMLEMRNDTGKSELMTPCSRRMSSLTINSSSRGKEMQLPSNSGGPRENCSPAEVIETKSLKWKPPRKIAGIYGDWPEGYSLPDNK